MQVPKRKSEIFGNPYTEEDNNITQAKLDMLKGEFEDLEQHQHAKASEDLRVAREMGDLSENAAYTEAKGRLRGINNRMLSLKERIKNAIVIDEGATRGGKVRIGSTVTLLVNGKKRIYQILGSQETSPGEGRISHHSPLGISLMGSSAGENIKVTAANGKEVEYQILEVS